MVIFDPAHYIFIDLKRLIEDCSWVFQMAMGGHPAVSLTLA